MSNYIAKHKKNTKKKRKGNNFMKNDTTALITEAKFKRRKTEREFERVENILETESSSFSQGEYQFYKGMFAALAEILYDDTFYDRYFNLTNRLEEEIERFKLW